MNPARRHWRRCPLELAFLIFVIGIFAASATAAPGVVNTGRSPFARVHSVGLGEARWTRGFWAERYALCQNVMIPHMWSLMAGNRPTQFFQNFRVAAGLTRGQDHGAPFNDGDFYKWLEGASASLAITPDPALERTLEGVIAVIGKAQRPDGYLDTRVEIRAQNGDTNAVPLGDPANFELYNLGHLMTAACVNYRATGKTNLLAIARKAADYLCARFQHPTAALARDAICPSQDMGIVELYRTTRNPRYLALARTFFTMRSLVTNGSDNNQDAIPFAEQTQAVGHAVRANYLYAGAADLFMETGEETLWNPLMRIWTNVVEEKMYITGGCGSLYDGASPDGGSHPGEIHPVHQAYGRAYQLPNLTAYSETCANIGNVLWNWRMFLATGQAKFMDVVELALYNSVLSGGGLDGTNFFYDNPLRVLKPMPVKLRWPRTRQPFFDSFCCPPNLVRTIAESADYAYARSADAIWVNLYGGSRVETRLADGGQIQLAQETDYPWNGRVRIKILACGTNEFGLKLRIPGWARGATVRLNDRPAEAGLASGTYFEIHRRWQPGDFVDLHLPMPARLVEANPRVEEDIGQVAVQRGPIVYCLESTDLPRGVDLRDVEIPADIHFIARYARRLLDGIVVLEGEALAHPAQQWHGALYRTFSPITPKSFRLRLIPYCDWDNRGPSEMSVWLPLAINS